MTIEKEQGSYEMTMLPGRMPDLIPARQNGKHYQIADMRYLALVFMAAYLLIAPVSAGSLLATARTGNSKHTDQIPELGTDVQQRGQQNETALHWMAFHGNEAMVKRLITSGADINARVKKGSTPLHLAAYKGHINVARLLVARRARVNIRTHDGSTPLDWALRNGNREVAELLITNGAKTGSSQAGTAITTRRSEKKLEDLKLFTHMKRILARHRPEPERPTMLIKPQLSKVQAADSHPQAGVFRIQLAALGTHERALETWNKYRSQHPDILGDRNLFVEPARVNGKVFYRVQTGLFTQRNAASLCNQLMRRSQPCLVVNSDPFWLVEQRKLKYP
jgi:hypothetical protein